MWRRKLEAGGDWWAQARDGSWSRWDQHRSDWVPTPAGPPGGADPLPPEGVVSAPPVRHGSGTGSVLWDFLKTFTAIATPGFFGLGLAMLVFGAFAALVNTLLVPWLFSEPIRIGDGLLLMLIGTVAVAFFLSVGITVVRATGNRGGLAVAVAVVAAGVVATLYAIARARGLGLIDLVTRAETGLTAFIVAASWGGLALRRWLAED